MLLSLPECKSLFLAKNLSLDEAGLDPFLQCVKRERVHELRKKTTSSRHKQKTSTTGWVMEKKNRIKSLHHELDNQKLVGGVNPIEKY